MGKMQQLEAWFLSREQLIVFEDGSVSLKRMVFLS